MTITLGSVPVDDPDQALRVGLRPQPTRMGAVTIGFIDDTCRNLIQVDPT